MSIEQLNDDPQCRICYESTNQEEMLHPCRCSGTSKWIHRSCLNQWRSLSTNPNAFSKCLECLYEYQTIPAEPAEKPLCESLGRFMSTNTFVFFVLNNVIIIVFSYFLLLVDTDKKLRNTLSHSDTIGYYSWSFIMYSSLIFSMYLFGYIKIKNKQLYRSYYRDKITCQKVGIFAMLLMFSVFFDILLTSLTTTIIFQLLLKLHFDAISRINTANDQTIVNYDANNDQELLNMDQPV